jgi:hypothetical protein
MTRVTTGVAGPASVTADAGIDRERVLSKYAQVLEADYFEILGVRRDATGYEVRRAFEAARRDYAREAFPADVQRDLDGGARRHRRGAGRSATGAARRRHALCLPRRAARG